MDDFQQTSDQLARYQVAGDQVAGDLKRNRGEPSTDNRRGFLRGSSLLLASALPASKLSSRDQPLRFGLIGCGRSGVKLAKSALQSTAAHVQLVAVADQFSDSLQQAVRALKSAAPGNLQPLEAMRFSGNHAVAHLLDRSRRDLALDFVLVAGPPVFRASLLRASIEAGVHAFSEQPVALSTDALRDLQIAGELADSKSKLLEIGCVDEQTQRLQLLAQQLCQCSSKRHPSLSTTARADTGANIDADQHARHVLQTLEHIVCNRDIALPHPPKDSLHLGRVEQGGWSREFRLRNWPAFEELSGDRYLGGHLENLGLVQTVLGLQVAELRRESLSQWQVSFRTGERMLSRVVLHPPGGRQRVGFELQSNAGSCDLTTRKCFNASGKYLGRLDERPANDLCLPPVQRFVQNVAAQSPASNWRTVVQLGEQAHCLVAGKVTGADSAQ